MNKRIVFRLLGALMLIEAVAMLPSLLVSAICNDGDWLALVIPTLILGVIGAPLYLLLRTALRRQKGELFVLADGETGKLLSVGALLHEDARWPDVESAYYLHHLASDPSAKGTAGIFLEMAEAYTARQGKTYMRLDSAIGNGKLEHYYASRGYVEAGFCKDGLYEGVLRQKRLVLQNSTGESIMHL